MIKMYLLDNPCKIYFCIKMLKSALISVIAYFMKFMCTVLNVF